MNEILKKISSPDFIPEKYVKEISQVCIGGLELQKHKAAVTALSEETNLALKKNVYKNYMQFIETAREISHLEGEMYQLSHLLMEQRGLLASMGSAPLSQQPNEHDTKQESIAHQKQVKEEKRLKALAHIKDKVEGCIVLTEVAGRELLYEGDLVELDLLENTAIHRCHAFLLSDILIITTWISNRRGAGSAKYKYEAVYELGSLAVVNVRDLGQVKYAFKLLVFPDTRLFQCANHQAKELWLNKLDETKRAKMNPEKKTSDVVQQSSLNAENSSPARTDSIDSGNNPFLSYSNWSGKESPDSGSVTPEWVCDSPEDLDVLIAQRHFEQAFALIQKTNSFLNKAPQTSTNLDIKTKVEGRIRSLIEVLLKELSVSSEKSMQGGLRASRRAVKLLNQLGKSSQACELYLKLCTSVLKSQMKRVKREFATTAYIKQLSTAFFSNLAFITNEFQFRAFPHNPSCSSGYVVWANSEVSHFTANAIKQIFMPQTPLETVAECVETIRKQCRQLTEVGLDVEYQVDGQLSGPASRALHEVRDKLIEAVKLRASEDQWKPSHHSKPALHKLQQDFTAFNLPPIKNYMTGDGWLDLTQNSIHFFRLYLSLLTDGLKLANRDLEYSLCNILYQVFDTHLRHVAISLKSDKLKSQRVLIHKNAVFLIEHLLKRSNEKYTEARGHSCKKLEKLRQDYSIYIKDTTVISNVTGYI